MLIIYDVFCALLHGLITLYYYAVYSNEYTSRPLITFQRPWQNLVAKCCEIQPCKRSKFCLYLNYGGEIYHFRGNFSSKNGNFSRNLDAGSMRIEI